MGVVIVAVAHEQFLKLHRNEISAMYKSTHKPKVLVDIKGIFDKEEYLEDYIYWRL